MLQPHGKAFISGPYSGDKNQIEANLSKARLVSESIIKVGWIPICPNLMFHPYADCQDYEFWIASAMVLLETCNIMILVPGWELSSGARREIKRALEIYMPIFDISDFGFPTQIISQCNDRIRDCDANLINQVYSL